ncbi:LTA synthase family protein [Pseudobacteroides cellulosolvens]|nr:LTA synthase family protein [Pseudobacteroides cellulosolvens]
MELDIKRLIPSFDNNEPKNVLEYSFIGKSVANAVYEIEATPAPSIEVKYTDITPTPEPHYEANILDIDFKSIISNEKNKTLLDMHKYFSSVVPTKKNEYTGIFKGYNLILITAEGFSPYAISPELTPTLYKMSTEGFVFNNFYNPIWKVSTSDGEFVACTGLIPKSGIWSFSRTGKNYMPFVMGNQFKNLGYTLKAYHNHSYKYYDRHISHPNMGYDYKGVGNGLNIKKTWPESDLEMIDVTAAEYIGDKPFHTYYMTVSGHLNYSFGGNYIARKNKSYVKDLPYSDTSKAYIACNLELEFAMKSLVKKLEAAGVADKTVIAISPDHYPYGLPKENIDELAGHKVEDNFELYKSTFILWKKGMDTVIIDKPCSSLDIMPTLSNLFGLDYDSRLLMGTDILSESDPLVIFSNRSWITDKARYNTASNSIEYTNGSKTDSNYIKEVNRIVSDKFKYSAKIIETDYYRKIIDSK